MRVEDRYMASRYIAAVTAAILLAVVCAHAGGGGETRVFQLPRYEAEQVIKDWLKKSGYQVRSEQMAEKIVLSATKDATPWEITLRHDSPLATEVTSGEALKGRADTLWKFLAGYEQGMLSPRGFPTGDVPDGVRNRMDSVVCIRALVKGRPIQLSGFVADASGLILCTAHTLKDPTDITVIPRRGNPLDGTLVRIDFRKDLALIDCSRPFSTAVPVNNGKPVPATDARVFSIGCPRNHAGTMVSGFVSGPPRLVEGQPLLAVRMEVEPGSSGSPVFDEQGDLVGMVQGRMKGDHYSGLLIPIETVISFIKE